MKIIKIAQLESKTPFYENKENIIKELIEAKQSGFNFNEHNVMYDNVNYNTVSSFILKNTGKEYKNSMFLRLYNDGLIKVEDIFSIEIKKTIPNFLKMIAKKDIDYPKIEKIQAENPSLSFEEAVVQEYPELKKHEANILIFNHKNDKTLTELLSVPELKKDVLIYIAKELQNIKEKNPNIKIDSGSIRTFYSDTEYRTENMHTYSDFLIDAIVSFRKEPELLKTIYENYPGNPNKIIEDFVTEQQSQIPTSIANFIFENKIGEGKVNIKRDFTNFEVFNTFCEIVNKGNWEEIKDYYDSLENVTQGLNTHQTSYKENPILRAPDKEVMTKMLEHCKELKEGKYDLLFQLSTIKGNSFKTIVEMWDKIGNDGYTQHLIKASVENDYVKETFTKLAENGVKIHKLPDVSDILVKHRDFKEENFAKHMIEAFEVGYDPSKINKLLKEIIQNRDKKPITALKNKGVIDTKGNIFLNSLIQNNLTSAFETYFPDRVTAEILNFKNSDGSLLWWNTRNSSFFDKIKRFNTNNPGQLNVTGKGNFFNTIAPDLKTNNKTVVNEILDLAIEQKKYGQPLVFENKPNYENKNGLHYILEFYNFIGYKSGKNLTKILTSDIQGKENLKEMFEQKDTAGRYPMDYFIFSSTRGTDELSHSHYKNGNSKAGDRFNFNSQLSKLFDNMNYETGFEFLYQMFKAPNSTDKTTSSYIEELVVDMGGDLNQLESLKTKILQRDINNNMKKIHSNTDDDDSNDIQGQLFKI